MHTLHHTNSFNPCSFSCQSKNDLIFVSLPFLLSSNHPVAPTQNNRSDIIIKPEWMAVKVMTF